MHGLERARERASCPRPPLSCPATDPFLPAWCAGSSCPAAARDVLLFVPDDLYLCRPGLVPFYFCLSIPPAFGTWLSYAGTWVFQNRDDWGRPGWAPWLVGILSSLRVRFSGKRNPTILGKRKTASAHLPVRPTTAPNVGSSALTGKTAPSPGDSEPTFLQGSCSRGC